MLFSKSKIVSGHHILALQTTATAAAQLGRDVIQERILESKGDTLPHIID